MESVCRKGPKYTGGGGFLQAEGKTHPDVGKDVQGGEEPQAVEKGGELSIGSLGIKKKEACCKSPGSGR